MASSLVKEVAAYGGDVSAHVPGFVLDLLTERLASGRVSGLAPGQFWRRGDRRIRFWSGSVVPAHRK